MNNLDMNIPIYYYFNEISKIPHGSYQEEAIADYIESIAIKHQLRYQRDKMHNMIVFKEASIGYEKHEPLILQAHVDMVNEKNNESDHDFDHDPLNLCVKDGYLCAQGTTLGGDDGYGVAYMLSLLSDDSLQHPPLECVFTVQEEVGLCGAIELDTSSLKGKRMINLDSDLEGETCTSSSGGCDVLIHRPIAGEDNYDPVYVIEIGGLLGGHSGGCIHMGRGNANKIAGRILNHFLKEGIDVRLIHIGGGLKNNAIPRECTVAFASSSSSEKIYNLLDKLTKDIQKELEVSDPRLTITIHQDECDVCICPKDSEAVISIMYLTMNGMLEQSQSIPGLTTLSLNMGIIRTHDDLITIDFSIRSPLTSAKDELVLHLETITHLFNGYIKVSHGYPGWEYDSNSQLRKLLKDCYKKYTNHEMKEVATHGGLETGVFYEKIKDLDIVTLGPNIYDIHTPDERMEMTSFIKTYEFLISFIETL